MREIRPSGLAGGGAEPNRLSPTPIGSVLLFAGNPLPGDLTRAIGDIGFLCRHVTSRRQRYSACSRLFQSMGRSQFFCE